MLPLLRQGKDMFIVAKKSSQRCKKGDVVLFRRGNDNVLHRVINVNPDSYDILGDNCTACEKGITDGDIMGVMTGFIRGGKQYSVDGICCKIYTFIILHTIGLRIFAKKVFTRAKRLITRRMHTLSS